MRRPGERGLVVALMIAAGVFMAISMLLIARGVASLR